MGRQRLSDTDIAKIHLIGGLRPLGGVHKQYSTVYQTLHNINQLHTKIYFGYLFSTFINFPLLLVVRMCRHHEQ